MGTHSESISRAPRRPPGVGAAWRIRCLARLVLFLSLALLTSWMAPRPAAAQTELTTVAVGVSPIFVTVSPDGRLALVLNFLSETNNVMIIDMATAQVVRSLTVGQRPQFADFTSNSEAIIGNDEALEVTFIDVNQAAILTRTPVGNRPEAVRVNPAGTLALVANGLDGTVTVIDVASRTATGTITVGSNPRFVSYTPDGAFALVVNGRSDDISVVDVSARAQFTTIPVGDTPTAVEILPDLSRAVVTNGGDDTVALIATNTLSVSQTISVGTRPSTVALNSQGTLAFVSNANSNTVSVISLTQNAHLVTFEAGNVPQSLALTPDGTRLLVINQLGNLVRIFDVSGIDPSQSPTAPPAPTGGSDSDGDATTVAAPDPPDTSGVTPTLFVNASASEGGDGGASDPFRSITGAVSAAQPGDVISVAAGTYSASRTDETIPIIVLTADVSIFGAGAATTVIDLTGSNGNGIVVAASGTRIEGFTVENGELFGIFAGVGLTDVRIANNLTRLNGNTGIGLQDVENCVIANNVSTSNDGHGFAANNSSCTFTNNTASSNVLDGILIGSGGNHTVIGNVILNNGSAGLEANNRPIPPNPERAMTVRLESNTSKGNGGHQFATVGSGFLITEGALAETIINNEAIDNVTGGISIFEHGRALLIANNNASSNRGEGIFIRTGASVESVTNNIANNNQQNGIFLDNDARVTVIAGNTTIANQQNGINVFTRSSAASIDNNTVTNNAANGIVAFASSVGTVTNNVIQDNGNSGIASDSGSTFRATGNTITGHLNSGALVGTNGGTIVAGTNTMSNNALTTFGSVQSGLALPSLSVSPALISSSDAVELVISASIPGGPGAATSDTLLLNGRDSGLQLLSLLTFDASGAGAFHIPSSSYSSASNGVLNWIVETASGAVSIVLVFDIP